MKRWIVVGLLLVLTGMSLAAPPDPLVPFTAVRRTASGGAEIITSSNGHIRMCVADADTLGKCKDCTYLGGPLFRWLFIPDSTYTYTPWETAGSPDSIVTAMQAQAYWGPGLLVPRGSVAPSALLADGDGYFLPGISFKFQGGDTLRLRWMMEDSTDALIHVLSELETQGITIDTTKALIFRKTLGGGLATSNYILFQLGDRIVLRGDSADVSIATIDSVASALVDADSLHALAAKIGEGGAGEGLDVDGTIYGTGNLSIDGKLTAGNAPSDSASLGIMRARSGEIVSGTAGQGGQLALSDGSGNWSEFAAQSWASDVTMALPIFIVDCNLNDPIYVASGQYRWSYYIAGVDTSWAPVPMQSALYDPGGAGEGEEFPITSTRPWFGYCKTDSLVLVMNTNIGDVLRHVFLVVGKKNLYLTR